MRGLEPESWHTINELTITQLRFETWSFGVNTLKIRIHIYIQIIRYVVVVLEGNTTGRVKLSADRYLLRYVIA